VRAVETCLRAARERLGCRIVHYSVQRSHVHLVVEAQGRDALSRGVKGLSIRVAKSVNRLLGRAGRVVEDRYHARALRTPREVKAAACYVLNNARKHERRRAFGRRWLDPCSSARWFDGWQGRRGVALDDDAPVATPRTWLMREGWRRHGPLGIDEVPGPSP
jgi:REP element-mobilizing transposase RayT